MKDYFHPTTSEYRGLMVLAVALLLAIAVGSGVYLSRDNHSLDSSQHFPHKEGSYRRQGLVGTREASSRQGRSSRYYAVPENEVETFAFDPNTADSTTLLRLGFAPFQVRGIYKYRAMGGRYHVPEDVTHIPGMTNEQWERLAPYVRIGRKYQYVAPSSRAKHHSLGAYVAEPSGSAELIGKARDTVRFPVKLANGQCISLNTADTAELKKVPGIGSYYARQIVRYRERLGGYVSLEQLEEIEGMPEGVSRWLQLDTSQIRRIDVNHATKNQLVRHPYLRVYRAQAIWNHLHNEGPLHSVDDLRPLPDFTEADIERLRPYLEFK
ncbi:MAG: helix-hairpin-helix domain-containing protein [Bacteroidaceae bacterium]|nr:helix-hairpin-helix domain-containing protein [Bacteroidaceae bacterium]